MGKGDVWGRHLTAKSTENTEMKTDEEVKALRCVIWCGKQVMRSMPTMDMATWRRCMRTR